MRKEFWRLTVATSICAAVAMLAACGGDSDSGGVAAKYPIKNAPAEISVSGVKSTLVNATKFVPSCTAEGVAVGKTALGNEEFAAMMKVLKLSQETLVNTKKTGKTVGLIPSTKPADIAGKCGGTLSFPTWDHKDGTTKVVIKFTDYCNQDSSSGKKTLINGSISAVDNGTPTASGPVTNFITADIPGLSVVQKDAAGTITASDSFSLTGFKYVPAANASADISNLPGTVTLTSFILNDDMNKKSIKMGNVTITTAIVSGETQITGSGRFYHGNAGYSDGLISATNPLVIDSNQDIKPGGIVTFTGANASLPAIGTVVVNTGTSTGTSSFSLTVGGTAAGTLTCDGISLF